MGGGNGLTELPKQIEHFGRNILAHRLLIGGAERLADLGRGAALLAGPHCFLTFNLLRGIAFVPPVLIVLEGQIRYPLAAGAAPARLDTEFSQARPSCSRTTMRRPTPRPIVA